MTRVGGSVFSFLYKCTHICLLKLLAIFYFFYRCPLMLIRKYFVSYCHELLNFSVGTEVVELVGQGSCQCNPARAGLGPV